MVDVNKVNAFLNHKGRMIHINCLNYAIYNKQILSNDLSFRIQHLNGRASRAYQNKREFQKIIVDLVHSYNLKVTKKELMKANKEYILFRLAEDDYHFMHRDVNGNWSHKRGGLPVENSNEEEAFGEKWINGGSGFPTYIYDSEIVVFEVLN